MNDLKRQTTLNQYVCNPLLGDIHDLLRDQDKKGPQCEKTCLRGFGNNTGADQPAHSRSLISAYVIRFLESITCKLATGEISIF